MGFWSWLWGGPVEPAEIEQTVILDPIAAIPIYEDMLVSQRRAPPDHPIVRVFDQEEFTQFARLNHRYP